MLYCNTATVAATRRAGIRRWGALGAQQAQAWALGRAGRQERAQQASGSWEQAQADEQARLGAGHEAATWPLGPAIRPALPATRPSQGPRYGHYALLGVPVCAWVCSAGPGGGVLCTLTRFLIRFDSVLFLSH